MALPDESLKKKRLVNLGIARETRQNEKVKKKTFLNGKSNNSELWHNFKQSRCVIKVLKGRERKTEKNI